MKIFKEHKLFIFATLIVSVISITGFDVFARISVRAESFMVALTESLYFSGVQFIGTLILLAPFLLLGGIAATATTKFGTKRGWCLFICGTVLLMCLYFKGHLESNKFLEQENWTASSLSLAQLPFQSIPVLIIGLGLGWVLSKIIEKKSS